MLTNVRTLLRSDWVDASSAVQWPIYILVTAAWVGAAAWSFAQYRRDRANESADAVAAQAARQQAVSAGR